MRFSYWYGPPTEPPWQLPTPPQFNMCCADGLPRATLIRSAKADTEPRAQQKPAALWDMLLATVNTQVHAILVTQTKPYGKSNSWEQLAGARVVSTPHQDGLLPR